MKILWFINTPALAGEVLNSKSTSGGWLEELNRYIQNKVDLYVAFHINKKIEPFKFEKTTYIPIYVKHNKIDSIKNLFYLKVLNDEYHSSYVSIINKYNPDIIHIHGTENSFGSIVGVVKQPVVVSIQGIVSIIYEHLINYKIEGFIPYSYKKILSKFKRMSKIEKETLNNVKYIISKSNWSSDIMKVLAPEAKVFFINNMLRQSFYNKKWEQKLDSNKELIITTTLSNSYLKGFDVISKTALLLKNLNYKFKWNVIGVDETSSAVKYVKKIMKSEFPKDDIYILGRKSEKEVVEYLLKTSIYVMTSRIENSPNNLNEALILGIPSIAASSGGTNSFIVDGEDGILVQSGDYYATAGAIINLFNNSDLAKKIGKIAREKAMDRHCINKVCNDTYKVYEYINQSNKI